MSPSVPGPSVRLIESSSAELRLREARAFVETHAARGDVWLVGASRGAVDDLARSIALARGGAVGLHRFSFSQMAAHLAAPVLAARGIAPATRIGAEAVAARAAFEARLDGALDYFEPVAATPGFPRALARTLHELALARVGPAALRSLSLGGPDLAVLLERFEEHFGLASATDRAALFEAACEAAGSIGRQPLLLLDVPLQSAVEFALAKRLIQSASDALATVPFGDLATLDYLATLGVEVELIAPEGRSDLTALRRYLFATRQPPEREATGDVRLFSAPGEGRECVEIARRILGEARAGARFDEMAVFLRATHDYVGLLEEAFSRAGIPAWFDRGTRRPHPAGRAFLAMLSCAVERLSAIRFAEYVALAQVPDAADRARAADVPPPADDVIVGFARVDTTPDEPEDAATASPLDSGDGAVVAGMLRAPWMWERLIVESAVIGGDPERWRRRLRGLAAQYEKQIAEAMREDPESPRVARLERDLRNLAHLAGFALPIVETLASWPAATPWSDWLDRFNDLAPRVLRRPARVQRVLGELRAMGAIGPVTLEEARDVLAERLRSLDEHPPADRYGRVFVGSPHQARGRAFRIVFVPALAERLFPQKPREDPMLLDAEMRVPLDAGLVLQVDRAKAERLLLRLAAGAATERLWLSYPRLDVSGARPRVPSFYVLDVMRAVTGSIPNHEVLQREAAAAGGAKLDWPAPSRAEDAIDEVEHDLSTLRELIAAPDHVSVRGHAHYLLRLNDALRRSVTRRWARARPAWRPQDGLVRMADPIRPMLASQRLGARPYSVTALQKFTTCPYQFVLSAMYRLEPNAQPEPLQRLDPLTKGAIFHEVQAGFFRALYADGRLPVTAAGVPDALEALDAVLARVAARHEEELAPAIARVWRDEISDIGRDLRVWVRRMAGEHTGSAADHADHAGWVPVYFEFAFGLPGDQDRDPASVPDPVLIDGRFKLRGSVDLIERKRTSSLQPPASDLRPPAFAKATAGKRSSDILRITDHKTGRNRTTARTVIGGGATLQPILYGLAVEKILGDPVTGGRLFYCTAAGGFADHPVPLSQANRRAALEALEIIDRAIELGFLPPAPADRACAWCDFRPVCGPDEPEHIKRKPAGLLGDLMALREMP